MVCLLINNGIRYVTEIVFLLCQRWIILNFSSFSIFHSVFSILLCIIYILLTNWPVYKCNMYIELTCKRENAHLIWIGCALNFCLLYHLLSMWINDFIKCARCSYWFFFVVLFLPLWLFFRIYRVNALKGV